MTRQHSTACNFNRESKDFASSSFRATHFQLFRVYKTLSRVNIPPIRLTCDIYINFSSHSVLFTLRERKGKVGSRNRKILFFVLPIRKVNDGFARAENKRRWKFICEQINGFSFGEERSVSRFLDARFDPSKVRRLFCKLLYARDALLM